MSDALAVEETIIPGLLVVRLPVHGDNRGWFKENWQREKMVALGLPDFGPVQNNVSSNDEVGVTRGIHAEPWDKFVSLAAGRIFGAWVDLRAGESFGAVLTLELGPETAVFVPRGVGNAFQTLAPGTAYSYLVNRHWSQEARDSYKFVNLGDPVLAIDWPISLPDAELSAADRDHPALADVDPFEAPPMLVLGSAGQLGSALSAHFPQARAVGRDVVDLAEPTSFDNVDWSRYDVVVNAAAYTAVDAAETPEGRALAWQVNVSGVVRLASLARQHGFTLVHISSDYVFDGSAKVHGESEPFTPLGVYAQTKAAGDAVVSSLPRHYILRTSWVVGAGRNFVRTMIDLADRGVSPSVVDDQFGRLSFTTDLTRAISHLLENDAPFGTYNVSSAGEVHTWADIARTVFELRARSAEDVTGVRTAEYAADKELAPRPQHSVLDLSKTEATGFRPTDGAAALAAYVRQHA